MDEARQPTLDDIEERFVALLDGRLSRDHVDRWAGRWVTDDRLVWDELAWWALNLLYGVDLPAGPTGSYLHDDEQLRAWLHELRLRTSGGRGMVKPYTLMRQRWSSSHLRYWDTEVMRARPGTNRHRFPTMSWDEVADNLHHLSTRYPDFRHMTDVVASIRACDTERQLAGCMAMHDLVVTARPVPQEQPVDVVIVRAPSSLVYVADGCVVIEHTSTTGYNERIERPASQTVPLFWRFMIEKFGIRPDRPVSAATR